jgi:chemotaxis protein methyltransferase CheR
MEEHHDPKFEKDLTSLFDTIYVQYRHDFRDYSRASMKRRMNQALNMLDCDSMTMLREKIASDANSFSKLLQYLTVPVSEMFRTPTYFSSFRETIVPHLRTYPSLKIWIAGCSTGEEVYSFAIILKEEELLERTIIYATDINTNSLEKAEAGVYKLSDVQKYTGNYQRSGGKNAFSDYYSAGYDAAVFDKSLKKNITFSDHSLATDSVFSETQFISCRNVFIYFERNLQNKAIGLFHESLCPKGFLGLAPKETIEFTKYQNCFDSIVPVDRIYQKNAMAPVVGAKL